MLKARKEAEEITELLQEQNEVDDSNIRNTETLFLHLSIHRQKPNLAFNLALDLLIIHMNMNFTSYA